MWEFSIDISSENCAIAKHIFQNLAKVVEELKGIITSYEHSGNITIAIACESIEKVRMEYHITNTLAEVICTNLKEIFLTSNLKLPNKSELEIYAFKKALVNFDRETDRFIVNKCLTLNNCIVLESFFNFRLRALKEKWQELISIANDNSTYLLSDDSFIELLKFLIDNIEIGSDEITVNLENGQIAIYNLEHELLNSPQNFDKFQLIDFIFENSPKKIIWTNSNSETFLEKIFSKRIIYA